MAQVVVDARLAELAYLDVLDVSYDGKLHLNAAFVAECRAALDADPACLDDVFQTHILARAAALGMALVDVEDLTLTALEVAVGDATELDPAGEAQESAE